MVVLEALDIISILPDNSKKISLKLTSRGQYYCVWKNYFIHQIFPAFFFVYFNFEQLVIWLSLLRDYFFLLNITSFRVEECKIAQFFTDSRLLRLYDGGF